MVDDTIYKRNDKGKKISKETKTAKLRFKDRSVDITKTITVGRDKSCDIVITDDPLVSRKHAILEKVGDVYYVQDNKSTNGTYVNNNPLPKGKKISVSSGDVIQVGKTKLHIT